MITLNEERQKARKAIVDNERREERETASNLMLIVS